MVNGTMNKATYSALGLEHFTQTSEKFGWKLTGGLHICHGINTNFLVSCKVVNRENLVTESNSYKFTDISAATARKWMSYQTVQFIC